MIQKESTRNLLLKKIEEHQQLSEDLRNLAKQLDERSLVELVYEIFSQGYDQHMEYTNHYRAARRGLDHLKKYLGSPFLDISCGTGELLHYLANDINSQNLEVVANDISAPMQAIARQKLGGKINRITFTSHDVRNLPWEGYFKTMLCSYSFHGFQADAHGRKSGLLKKMYRALASGGHLIFLEEFPPQITPSPYLPPAINLFLPDTETPVHIDFGGGWLEVSAKDAGFQPISVSDYFIDNKHRLYTLVLKK